MAGGGSTLGTVTVSDPGVKLLLADGLTAADVSVTLELPERYLLGVDPAVYAVYTIHGRDVQETASVRVPAAVTGLEELLAKSANATLPASRDVGPKRIAGGLLAISVGATVLAALAAFGVVRAEGEAPQETEGETLTASPSQSAMRQLCRRESRWQPRCPH